ncbi:MAG: isochorismate synthase [bacterium]|nr:isochorismate synthase [bacterium]
MNLDLAIADLCKQIQFLDEPTITQIIRVEVPVYLEDILAVLHLLDDSVKLYWSSRDDKFEIAGIGIEKQILVDNDNIKNFSEVLLGLTQLQDKINWFSIAPFIREDSVKFILPKLEITQKENKYKLACYLTSAAEILWTEKQSEVINWLHQIKIALTKKTNAESLVNSKINVSCAKNNPERVVWDEAVKSLLVDIEQHLVQKVVLARTITYVANDDIDGLKLIAELKNQVTTAFVFYVQLEKAKAFLGASPEQLFSRKGRRINTEAQAGTRPLGINSNEVTRFSQELLASKKDELEQWYVLNEINAVLTDLCDDFGVIVEREIVKSSHVQHLRTRLGGILKENINDLDILNSLHPTAAVCGLPKTQAFIQIAKAELFDRGLYAGAIGYVGLNSAEFCVAIRCAYLERNQIVLYAGAGIVQGSVPEAEWHETQNKMSMFDRVLHVVV